MTTRQLVNQLRNQGYNVTFYVRKDGGILITSINGERFKGAKGNVYARSLLGEVFSERRTAQLTKITRERVKRPRKIPVETPEDLERFRKRVMRKWRKAGLTGSISKKNLRKIIEERGFEGAKTYLEEMERHSEGRAYYGQIKALLERIANDIDVLDNANDIDNLKKAYDLIDKKRDEIKAEWINDIFDKLYDFEHYICSSSDFYLKVKSLFDIDTIEE